MNTIYTRNEAADIVALFEDVLDSRDISVPSDEDDERDEDNMIGLYGMTYWDLLDSVEGELCDFLSDAKNGCADLKRTSSAIVEMFKTTLENCSLSVPEVSGVGEEYNKFLSDVEASLAPLLKLADGAEVVSDVFADEVEYSADKA